MHTIGNSVDDQKSSSFRTPPRGGTNKQFEYSDRFIPSRSATNQGLYKIQSSPSPVLAGNSNGISNGGAGNSAGVERNESRNGEYYVT